jgi:putative hydrolase of the HAD superfamily
MSYLLWDFDNTLAHRPGLWGQCLADTVNSLIPSTHLTSENFRTSLSSGFPWHTPDIEHHHLSDPDAWWAGLLPVLATAVAAATGMDVPSASEIAARVRDNYLDPTRWVVFPDTEPALAQLTGRGWRHVILSNHVPELPALVKALGLGGHFERVLTSATLGYEKPHPAAFKTARLEIPSGSRIVMIGDSFMADFKGARAVGLEAILVRGSHPECDASCADLYALVDHLHAVQPFTKLTPHQ